MRRPLDGLGRAGRGRPDRRMRLLIGPRPHVHVLEVIVLALERERPRLGPGLHHEVVRLLEARVRDRRVDAHRVVLGADAAHHAGDQPPAGDAVDHGVLLGERERMLAQAEGVAEDRDLGVLGAARQRGRHHHRRGHQSVGVLVMLVDGDAVVAELGDELELVEVAVVELVALLRVEIGVRQHHPGGAVLLRVAHVEVRVGHQMEREDFHRAALRMNCETSLGERLRLLDVRQVRAIRQRRRRSRRRSAPSAPPRRRAGSPGPRCPRRCGSARRSGAASARAWDCTAAATRSISPPPRGCDRRCLRDRAWRARTSAIRRRPCRRTGASAGRPPSRRTCRRAARP